MAIKKVLASVIAALAMAATGGSAQAASCHNWACVNRTLSGQQGQIVALQGQVSTLHTQVTALTSSVGTLRGVIACLGEVPMTRYGSSDGSSGYLFDNGDGNGPFLTTGLDLTASGDPVGGWMLYDGCNSRTTAAADTGHLRAYGIAPEAPISSWLTPIHHR